MGSLRFTPPSHFPQPWEVRTTVMILFLHKEKLIIRKSSQFFQDHAAGGSKPGFDLPKPVLAATMLCCPQFTGCTLLPPGFCCGLVTARGVWGGEGHPRNRKLRGASSSLGWLFHILLVRGIYQSTIVSQVLGVHQGIRHRSLRSQGICIPASRREEMYCGCCWLSAVKENTSHEG